MKTALLILLSISTVSMAAISPYVQIDKYLTQAEKANRNQDHHKTAAIIDKIITLKEKHALLATDFYLKHAQVLLQIDTNKQSNKTRTAIEKYLNTAGEKGKYYLQALDLYDNALNQQLHVAKTAAKIKQLVELGADVNAQDKYGNTALHYAAKSNNINIVIGLIANEANINARGFFDYTPLHYAVKGNNNLNIIKVLISQGVDVNAKSFYGWTPLHYAALYNNNTDTIKYLISEWADTRASNYYGIIPFDLLEHNDKLTIEQKTQFEQLLKP